MDERQDERMRKRRVLLPAQRDLLPKAYPTDRFFAMSRHRGLFKPLAVLSLLLLQFGTNPEKMGASEPCLRAGEPLFIKTRPNQCCWHLATSTA